MAPRLCPDAITIGLEVGVSVLKTTVAYAGADNYSVQVSRLSFLLHLFRFNVGYLARRLALLESTFKKERQRRDQEIRTPYRGFHVPHYRRHRPSLALDLYNERSHPVSALYPVSVGVIGPLGSCTERIGSCGLAL